MNSTTDGNKNTENVDITRPKVNLIDIASPNMTPEASKVVSDALERSAGVMNRVTTERDIDEILISFAKAIRKEVLALGSNDPSYEVQPLFFPAKQAIEAHYKAKFEKLMLDIIGEDENDTAPDGEILRDSVMRNRLRANLREKLK